MKHVFMLLFATSLYAAEIPKTQPFPFNSAKPACNLVDGKLILARAWPYGSWEDCAYSILSVAAQLDAQRIQLTKQLEQIKK